MANNNNSLLVRDQKNESFVAATMAVAAAAVFDLTKRANADPDTLFRSMSHLDGHCRRDACPKCIEGDECN